MQEYIQSCIRDASEIADSILIGCSFDIYNISAPNRRPALVAALTGSPLSREEVLSYYFTLDTKPTDDMATFIEYTKCIQRSSSFGQYSLNFKVDMDYTSTPLDDFQETWKKHYALFLLKQR